jgi:hypothetical protein
VQVDTTNPATHTIEYVVTDQTGLTATSTRTVIVGAANDVVSPAATGTVPATTTISPDQPRLSGRFLLPKSESTVIQFARRGASDFRDANLRNTSRAHPVRAYAYAPKHQDRVRGEQHIKLRRFPRMRRGSRIL